MKRNTLLTDAGIALVAAIILIVISPGLAVVGIVALLVLLVCALSFGIDRVRKQRRENPVSELRRSRAAEARAARRRSRAGEQPGRRAGEQPGRREREQPGRREPSRGKPSRRAPRR